MNEEAMGKRQRLSSEQIQQELFETAGQPFVPILREILTAPDMFESVDSFRAEGFDLVDHSETKIMAGTHKRLRGYLIKKYNNDKPGKKQLQSYMHRVEGARLLRTFITERGLQRVVAPRKFLYELPSSFPERYLVVAEKLSLLSRSATERAYGELEKGQAWELAMVLYYFRGLNSTAENLPFTEDGKIAFIDTERWHRDKDLLRKVGDRLSRKRLQEVEDVHRELSRQGERQFESVFK